MTSSTEQQEKLARSLALWEHAVGEERVSVGRSLSVATWDRGRRTATVQRARGPHFATMGAHVAGNLCLTAMETLYLLERGALELWCDGVAWSVQQAYVELLDGAVAERCYLVYAHLRQLGFAVYTFDPRYVSQRPPPDPPDVTACAQPEAVHAPPGATGGGDGPDALRPAPAPMAQEVAPAAAPRTWRSVFRDALSYIVQRFSFGRPPEAPQRPPTVTPLVPPREAASYARIFELLRIVHPHRLHELPSSAVRDRWRIDLVAYKPRAGFRKTAPGRADFCVRVCGFRDDAPTLAHLQQLAADANGVPVKLAVVDGGSVVFYGLLDTPLPIQTQGLL